MSEQHEVRQRCPGCGGGVVFLMERISPRFSRPVASRHSDPVCDSYDAAAPTEFLETCRRAGVRGGS